MYEGIYSVSYSGMQGMGSAMLVFQRGLITGADIGGVRYDGLYALGDNKKITAIRLKISAPHGAKLVTGATLEAGDTFNIQLSVPSFSSDVVAPVQIPSGTANVELRFLRALAA